jgi:hypothetical protein
MSDIAERIVLVMATFVEVLLSEPDLGVDLVWLTALELPDPSCEISRSGRDENSCARRSMYSCSALAASCDWLAIRIMLQASGRLFLGMGLVQNSSVMRES